jgi:hypothetical protein
VAAPHSWPLAVTGRVRRSPAIKPSQSSHSEAPPSFPLFKRPLPLFNPLPP